MRLLAYSRHDEHVVVGSQRHEEHEHQEWEHEVDAALTTEVNEDQRCQPQRCEVGEQHAGDQVKRRNQAAHDDREQDGDEHCDHGNDVPEVGGRELVHVVGERLNAEDALRLGVHPHAGAVRECAQRRHLGDGCRGTALLDADVLHGAPVGADEPGKGSSREGGAARVHRDQLRGGQRLTRE